MKRKDGISLIILAVTVIVMIIISSAVILTITGTDIIDESEATVKDHNLAEIQSAATIARRAYVLKTEREGEDPLVGSQKYIIDKLLEKGVIKQEELPDYYISKEGEVERVDRTAFIIEVLPNEDDNRIRFMAVLNATIDWGDGTVEKVNKASISTITHDYTSRRRYNVKIMCNKDNEDEKLKIFRMTLSAKVSGQITNIKSFGEVRINEITILDQPLEGLATPSNNSFAELKTCKFGNRFISNKFLNKVENIPDHFFMNALNLKNVNGLFEYWGNLKTIPENLFNKNVALADISTMVNGCTNLRGNAPEIWNSEKYPNVSVTNYMQCFTECQKLSNYEQIPESWKMPQT